MTDHNARQAGLTLIREKLQRFEDCAGDDEGCDIGRDWFDALTTIGFLERTQRSPAMWSMSPAGESFLAAHSADARNGEVTVGWKLVPIEPTQEMAKAYLNLSMKSWRQSYIAMLEAAPAAPAPTEDEIEAQDKSIADAATMKLMFINVMAAFATGRNLEAQLHAAYDWCERSGMVKKYSTMERAASAPAPAAQADVVPSFDCTMAAIESEHTQSFIDGAKWAQARIRQQSATPPECTCPSGNGSLRHPCPVHAVGAVPEIITQWRDAWQAHVDATAAYNARVALSNGLGAFYGASCQGEYEAMHDAKNKVYRMLPDLFSGIASLSATPADAASDPIRAVVQAAVDLMEAREWAEHFAECHAPGDALASRLEACITDLHNEAYGGEDRADAASERQQGANRG